MSVPGKQVTNGTYEFDYLRTPDTRSRWQVLKNGLYNPDEGTYLGHPPKKWAITATFYAVFFSCLALFFAICMKGLLASLYDDRPKWMLEESIIGTNPGLGFRPLPDVDSRALIWYSAKNTTQVEQWTDRLDNFLAVYRNSSLLPNEGRNQQVCGPDQPLQPGKVCEVEVKSWEPCTSEDKYGFNNSAPCIFIKLNRIYGWVPEYYNDTNDLPTEMPEELVNFINNVDNSSLNTVWVSCKGENPHDVESIGEIKYFPEHRGFAEYYYPYKNTPGYLSPLVAVYFQRPTRNQIINVECRAWAKNIKYDTRRGEKSGAVHFELLIDD